TSFAVGGGDNRAEQSTRKIVLSYGSLRVPLNGENEVIRVGTFDCFDNCIDRAAGDHSQTLADQFSRLMMAGVHWDRMAILVTGDCGECRPRLDCHVMSYCDFSPSFVVNGRFDVLKQGSAAEDIDTLQAVADAEHRLTVREGIG